MPMWRSIGPRQLGAADSSITGARWTGQLPRSGTCSAACGTRSPRAGWTSPTNRYSSYLAGVWRRSRRSCAGSHPGGGPSPPAIFIPIAEASGLIHAHRRLGVAGRLPASGDLARRWPAAQVAVNVSATQLRRAEFPTRCATRPREWAWPRSLLELELTESVFLDPSKEQIHETLRRIAGYGVTLAIDDFGTGYSSLAYLKHFPVRRGEDRRLVRAPTSATPRAAAPSRLPSSVWPTASASGSRPRASRPPSSSRSCASGAATRHKATCLVAPVRRRTWSSSWRRPPDSYAAWTRSPAT